MIRARATLLRGLRRFLDARGFLEVEAPTLVVSPGLEPHLDAFEVRGDGPRRYLHTSPEYALKRLLGAGHERLYSLGPCFRDEPPSRTHSPEFTLLEWYEVGLDLPGLMEQAEALVAAACKAVCGGTRPDWVGAPDLAPPYERLSVRAAFERHAGVDPFAHPRAEDLRAAAREAGVAVPTASEDWDDVFFQVFLNAVEPHLGQDRPTFLWGYPASQAALARLDPEDPTVALRFELFAGGFELANAFDELTDPAEQRARFEGDQAARRAAGRPVYPIDEALLDALGRMRPTSGIALGVDRLLMLLTGADHIDRVRAQPWGSLEDRG